MSFGLRDSDWVDPPEIPPRRCSQCDEYTPCPCGCGWGICDYTGEWVQEGDECG